MISPVLPDHVLEKMDPRERAKLGKAGRTMREAIELAEAKSERDLQKQIANWLRLHGYAFYQSAMHKKTTGTVGWPDFTFAVNSRACALEVKFGSHKPEPEQWACMSAMMVNGWRVEVVYSLEQAIAAIRKWEGDMA